MDNKTIVQEYSKRLWEEKDLNIIDEYFVPDAVITSPLNTTTGSFTMKEIAGKWIAAFPDLNVEWQDFIAEDNKVVSRWRATGTHMGSFFETSPTHREVTYSGVTIYTLHNGKIIEYFALVDMHSILNQLREFESIAEVVE